MSYELFPFTIHCISHFTNNADNNDVVRNFRYAAHDWSKDPHYDKGTATQALPGLPFHWLLAFAWHNKMNHDTIRYSLSTINHSPFPIAHSPLPLACFSNFF